MKPRYVVAWFPFLFWTGTVLSQPVADERRAQQNFMLNCQGCHRADGSGAPGKVPDFRSFLGKFLQVPGGREFVAQVPGVANAPLGDADLAEVLNWTLLQFSATELPQPFVAFTSEELGRLRKQVRIDVESERRRLLQLMDSAQ